MTNNLIPVGTNAQKVTHLLVKTDTQRLIVCFADSTTKQYSISTAQAGVGNAFGSYKTPLGWHVICEKIGSEAEPLMIFKGRQATGELATISHSTEPTGKDIITSRILWLQGLEEGHNLGGDVDSRQRYIYIHGTHEEGLIGVPASKGCIRMKNEEIIEVYDMVTTNTKVLIT